ncbi:MAG: type II secretion system F family protein [Candidatus Omnitrophota bacterium]|nr:type II secretion system F family protein [Candidatus Omnitrophota bacterium]
MPTFAYIAKDPNGNSVKAQESALSEHELKVSLARKNLVIISMREVKRSGPPRLFGSRIKTTDLVIFCKQLATMIKGGVPLLRAISSIAEEMKNPLFRSTLGEISRHVQSGESLSDGFKRFPRFFSPLFTSIVAAGEKVGSLDTMLERLSAYMQARDRLNKKIVAALTYPAFVLVAFVGAILVITLVLVPRFRAIYSGFGAQLPLITRIVFSFSDLMTKNILYFVITVAITTVLFYKYFIKSERGRRILDNVILQIPVFGEVIKNAALSKFARTLSTLLSQGIPIATSLDLVSKASGNIMIEEAINKIRSLIMDGESIPEALKKAQIFPSLMIQMVTVGVESGSLPELLDKTADFYEDRVSDFVAILTALIEPVLIVSLGMVMGVVIVALYMPIFNLSSAVGGAH